MNYSDSIKAILLAAINELSKTPENYAVKPGVDFIRNRKLGFKDYMLMFLTMEADCIREALHKLGDSDSSIFKDNVVFKYANDEDTIKRLCGLK